MTTPEHILYREGHEFYEFLQNHKKTKSQKEHSMTGMPGFTGTFMIPDEEYPKFLDLFHDWHFQKKKCALPLVEQPRPEKSKPLLIDFDFKYTSENAFERKFNYDHIEKLCKRIAEGWNHFFDLAETYEKLRFFVMLRPQPYPDGKDKFKDGIHIVCPELCTLNEKWNVVRQYLLEKNIIQDVFGDTGYMNKSEDIYDKTMGGQQGWMFYGASKYGVPAYKLTNVLAYDPSNETWEEEDPSQYSDRELLNILSVRYNVEDDINELREEVKEEYQGYLKPKQEAIVPTPQDLSMANNPLINALVTLIPQTDSEVNVIRQMTLECLSEERAEEHDSWMRVGWCLHNIHPSDEMFDLWMEFSKKSPKWEHHRKYEVSKLRREWHHGMRKEGDGPRLGMRTLYYWAREDNYERYKQIIDADTCEYIIMQTDTTHFHIAQLMKKMFGSLYIASISARNTDWFYYDEMMNMWRKLNQGMELRQKICLDVANQIQSAANKIGSRFANTHNPGEKEQLANKMKQLHEMQTKLYNSGFNESVMKMCGTLFYEDDFVNKLNINPFLFGCANGVLELRNKSLSDTREHVVFRQGRPEDYISFLAGRNHPVMDPIQYHKYDPNDPKQKEIQEFFVKLFPRDDLRKHVLKVLASCLEGTNREQLFYLFQGVGSNGKSKLIHLMKVTFGDYQTSFHTTVLTRKRPESGAANPDIMAMKCRRFIHAGEPDRGESLNTSRMKQFSGEDLVEARALFSDQEKFTIMGRMFMLCNELPPVSSMDNGTWRRIRVIPFESRFEDHDHPDLKAGKPNFYVKDKDLDSKLTNLREAFLALLVHIYETEYIPNGISPEPDIVKQQSERYKADFDVFAAFRSDRIRERRNGYEELTNEVVALKDIAKCYRRWADATSSKKMDVKEIEHKCEEAFGDSRGKKIYTHIRVFMEEEDVEDFDKLHEENAGEA
jgi:P4 family phage/plasmid primase-like protien